MKDTHSVISNNFLAVVLMTRIRCCMSAASLSVFVACAAFSLSLQTQANQNVPAHCHGNHLFPRRQLDMGSTSSGNRGPRLADGSQTKPYAMSCSGFPKGFPPSPWAVTQSTTHPPTHPPLPPHTQEELSASWCVMLDSLVYLFV